MSEKTGQIVYRALHAPKADGSALIEPPMSEFADQVTAYFRRPPSGDRVCFGARSALLHRIEARVEFFRRMVEESRINAPIVMVGHQPLLFHPGVWIKNFVASRVAQRVQGNAINLIVDNDLIKGSSILAPSREGEGVVTQVTFDAPAEEMPAEERNVVEVEELESFPQRVVDAMPVADWKPLIAEHGPGFIEVWKTLIPDCNLGRLFAAFRRTMETHWGYPIFDLPLSAAIATRSFARLVLEIVRDARSFAEIYNACLRDYRNVHGLRSRSHPAPDLEIASDNEIELPFWLWTTNAPRRNRTFVRRIGDVCVLSDRDGMQWTANLADGEALLDRLVDAMLIPTAPFEADRPKLRPKALITTLYARYLLCDGFVHGIGGAKYDQVTEAIAARWGLGKLAPMQCATMTLHLPLEMKIVTEDEVRRKKRAIRDLVFHPERSIDEANLSPNDRDRAKDLIRKKRLWIDRTSPEELRERHQALAAINAELNHMLANVRASLEQDYSSASAQFIRQQPWRSREFPAVLFPESLLRAQFERATRDKVN